MPQRPETAKRPSRPLGIVTVDAFELFGGNHPSFTKRIGDNVFRFLVNTGDIGKLPRSFDKYGPRPFPGIEVEGLEELGLPSDRSFNPRLSITFHRAYAIKGESINAAAEYYRKNGTSNVTGYNRTFLPEAAARSDVLVQITNTIIEARLSGNELL